MATSNKSTRNTFPTQDSPTILDVLLLSFRRSLLARNVSAYTIRAYLDTSKRFVGFLKARNMPTDPSALTREHVETYLTEAYTQIVPRTGRTPATATRKAWYAALRALFKWLEEIDEIKESPMWRMSPPKGHSQKRPVLTDEQVRAVLRVCERGTSFKDRRDSAIIRLFIDTGLRVSEMAGIMLADIDWDAQAITIPYGKGGKSRVVYFGRKSARVLDQYVHLRGGRREHKDTKLPHLWLGYRGPFAKAGITEMLSVRGQQAGLPKLYPHLYRHYFIHSSLLLGMQVGDLLRQTGHTKVEMLLKYGEAAADERARESHRRIGPGDHV